MNQDMMKFKRIFRPWDHSCNVTPEIKSKIVTNNVILHDNSQDCTISTTTEVEVGDLRKENESDRKQRCEKSISATEKADYNDLKHQQYIKCENQLCSKSRINLSNKFEKTSRDKTIEDNQKVFHTSLSQNELYCTPTLDIAKSAVYANLSHNYPTYPEMVPTTNSVDSMFSEFLHHGYNFEEYARVLSQEHQAKLLSARKLRPKKYKCPHCEVGFSNNGQLKGHIRIHTGERPFRCDEKNCGKTFTRNEELTRHKRIHSGLRPFACAHCGKRFGRKDHLKKHSRTHLQPREIYAVPVVLPLDVWTSNAYNYIPLFGY